MDPVQDSIPALLSSDHSPQVKLNMQKLPHQALVEGLHFGTSDMLQCKHVPES